MVVRFNTEDVTIHLASAGAGKAGWVDAVIPTPDGYRRFGSIKVGDKVFSAEGKPVTVTGVYPRGFMDAYRVTLSDGRSSICAADHLWGVYVQGHREWVYKVVSLEEMMSKGIRRVDPRPGRTFGQPKFYIPASPVCEYEGKELPTDPYALGSLIGNGCLTEKYLTISSNDEWQVAKVADKLGFAYHKRSDFNYSWDFYKDGKRVRTDSVIDFESLRCGAGAKFIPYDYLMSDLKSRIELLQGLFDTDGCVNTTGGRLHVSYSTTSYALATSLRQLLLSLGIVSTIYEDKREGKNICYELKVNCDSKLKELLFSLPRKAEKVKSFKRQVRHNYDRVAIRSVEKLERKLEMQCIMVDDPSHLYLCEDFIVTHNTTTAMQEITSALKSYRPDEIAFVTYTKKGVETGVARALAVNKDLTPDDLMHFKTLHALCFREAHLARKNIITQSDIAQFNSELGFSLTMNDAFGHVTEDDRLLQRYDAERSGSKRGVFVDGNYDRFRYDRLVNAYKAFKEGHDLVDFYDCLLKYMEQGEPLQGVKIALIDECFSPDTKVRMGDGTVRKIKDIKVGDYVMGVQGPIEVTSVHSGTDTMYDVVSGKNKLMYTCNSRHLIQQRHAKNDGYRWNHCEDIKRRAFVECTWFEGKDFIEPKIDPYFFGLWLGNGLSCEATVVCNENDIETISWLKAYGESLGDKVTLRHRAGIYQVEYSLPDKVPGKCCAVRKQLEAYGFMCSKSKVNPLREYAEKRIPFELLQASKDIRYKVLAGIIDSDGMYVACGDSKARKYRIEMARKPLMEDIYELLCGLGLNPTWYVTYHTTNGVSRMYYRVDFFGNSNIRCLLPRKQYEHMYDESRISCHISYRGTGEYVGITVASDDHLFLLANGCVVHNCQDLTPLQWQVCMKAFSEAEKVICLGDDFQCQPAGSLVLTKDGYVPIEKVDGKSLITFSAKDYSYYGKQRAEYVPTVASRHYEGDLIKVSVNGTVNKFTPEHKMLVRWNNRDTSLRCVYLMRKGDWFRVGQCQLFNRQGATHFILRMNNEGAEEGWILRLCHSEEDALVWEQKLSLEYGIPQISWKMWHGNLVERLYDVLGAYTLGERAKKLLEDLHLRLDLPMFNHEKAQAKSGGSCMSLCEACNLLPEVMSVPVYYGASNAKKSELWKSFEVSREWYYGDVYSLDVPKYHTYVTKGGLTVHNCLYTYNGAAPELLVEMASHYKTVKHEISYRLPRKVYEFSKGITDLIQEKVEKDYRPADDREGFVETLPDRNVLARLIRDDLKSHGAMPGRWYLLFRTNCFIADMATVLEQFIVPYHTSKGFCIPARDLNKIERYYNYRKVGYGNEEAKQRFMEENKISDINDSFMHSELIPGKERYFYQDLVDTWGLETLKKMSTMTEPFCLLSTVHKVKGGEADYTAMFMDCTRVVSENITLNADEELRVLYVGCTRSREGLYLIPASGKYSLSKLIDIVKELNDAD